MATETKETAVREITGKVKMSTIDIIGMKETKVHATTDIKENIVHAMTDIKEIVAHETIGIKETSAHVMTDANKSKSSNALSIIETKKPLKL